MFAVFHDRTEIVTRLLSSEFEDYITPYAILSPPKSNDANHVFSNGDEDMDLHPNYVNLRESLARRYRETQLPNRQLAIYHAIQNRNAKILELLLETFLQSFEYDDIVEIAQILLEPQQRHCASPDPLWLPGFQIFLRSHVLRLLFCHLRPEDKHGFLCSRLIDPVLQMQNRAINTGVQQSAPKAKEQKGKKKNRSIDESEGGGYIICNNCKLTQAHIRDVLKTIMREVKDSAYVGYATLKYPGLFHKYEILDKSLE